MDKYIEIFTLVAGVVYVILEIRQKNFMWVLGILTSLASMWLFYVKGAYASFALNLYYLVTAFIGLWQWRRDVSALGKVQDAPTEERIRIRRLDLKTAFMGLLAVVAIAFVLSYGMDWLHGAGILNENPMSWLDASIAAVSMVATWWLVRSYLEQWWLWIAANLMSMVFCVVCGMWWMAFLYAIYAAASMVGLRHWKKCGYAID